MFTAYKHPPEQHLDSSRDLHRQIRCNGCVRPSRLPCNAACDGWRRLDICGTLAVWFRHSAWWVQCWWSWAQDKRITAHGCIPESTASPLQSSPWSQLTPCTASSPVPSRRSRPRFTARSELGSRRPLAWREHLVISLSQERTARNTCDLC